MLNHVIIERMDTCKALDYHDLAKSREFREFFEITLAFTGLRVALVDPSGTQTVKLYPDAAENPLCRLIQAHPLGTCACRETDRQNCLRAAQERESLSYLCHAGLVDIAVPLFVDGQHIATMNCGQVLPECPTAEGFHRLLSRVDYCAGQQAALRDAYMHTPCVRGAQLENIMRLFAFFAEYFCEVGRRLKAYQRQSKNEGIDLARRYLRQHFREPVSLEETASRIHYAPAYLSALFRKATGMTYTEYIQHLRIDEAKRLLTITERGVTEIASEVGFNSLTHFNRIFKKLEGCAPSSYRAQQRRLHTQDH